MAFPYLDEDWHFQITKEREVDLTFSDLQALMVWSLRVRYVKMTCLGPER